MKTSQGLAEYAIAQLGRPYWWGCFGQMADGALYAQKKKQYPGYYTAGDFASQYGQVQRQMLEELKSVCSSVRLMGSFGRERVLREEPEGKE